jgi:Tfp pilus assembly protein PilF
LTFYHSTQQQKFKGNVRVYHYLEQYIENFDYVGVTLNADDAFNQNKGNCLTLAILTKALADIVGLNYEFQRVNSPPIYARNNQIMTLSAHVRTFILDPDYKDEPGYIVFTRPKIVIDYFPNNNNVSGHYVSEEDFIAMYYQNLAADALMDENYDVAYSLLVHALKISPQNAETINSLAVLLMKNRQNRLAGQLLKFVIDNKRATANVFSNYILYLKKSGKTNAVDSFIAQIDEVEEDNPYKWLDLAQGALDKNTLALATKYFKKALKLAPYLDEAYFGLAKCAYLNNELLVAEKYLLEATEIAFVPKHKRLYSAKLSMLRSELD